MSICRIILLIIYICLTAGVAVGQEPLPAESGFSGYIEVLGAYISTNSQFDIDFYESSNFISALGLGYTF